MTLHLPPEPEPKSFRLEWGGRVVPWGDALEALRADRLAVARAVVEQAEKVCKELHAEYLEMAKGDTMPTYDFMALGALDASEAVRALLDEKEPRNG